MKSNLYSVRLRLIDLVKELDAVTCEHAQRYQERSAHITPSGNGIPVVSSIIGRSPESAPPA
jgi:hypothetical protein